MKLQTIYSKTVREKERKYRERECRERKKKKKEKKAASALYTQREWGPLCFRFRPLDYRHCPVKGDTCQDIDSASQSVIDPQPHEDLFEDVALFYWLLGRLHRYIIHFPFECNASYLHTHLRLRLFAPLKFFYYYLLIFSSVILNVILFTLTLYFIKLIKY